MQKSSLRQGTPKPRLSDLLHRRSQTVEQYATELGITHEASLEMHCVMHGIVKDIALPSSPVSVKLEVKMDAKELEKAVVATVEKKKAKHVKNALVDLTDLVHSGRQATDPSDEG